MKILIYITLVLVGLAGGVYFFLTNQKDESKVAEVVVAEKDEVEARLCGL
jgi:flagellar basal body-associated protein FliL